MKVKTGGILSQCNLRLCDSMDNIRHERKYETEICGAVCI